MYTFIVNLIFYINLRNVIRVTIWNVNSNEILQSRVAIEYLSLFARYIEIDSMLLNTEKRIHMKPRETKGRGDENEKKK